MKPEALELPHGTLRLPCFLPDATRAVVRSVDSQDLEHCGVQGVVMNIFHLMQRPGSSTVKALGGLHALCAWPHTIITDSGGFQAYSLIRQRPGLGNINNEGLHFRPEGASRTFRLTPEKAIQLQLSYGADVVMCLDECTHPDDAPVVQQAAVEHTIDWAMRCKREFQARVERHAQPGARRPLLFAVVQGGADLTLRKRCAQALLDMGFDGFGFGGWPLDAEGHLLSDVLAYTRELIPQRFPLHALGVGHPHSVTRCAQMGYGLFDSALPTRDARRGRLYALSQEQGQDDGCEYVYINDAKHIKAQQPIDADCDCACCQHYCRGYLHHLFKINDSLYLRLATLHNLRFMTQLLERIRGAWHG